MTYGWSEAQAEQGILEALAEREWEHRSGPSLAILEPEKVGAKNAHATLAYNQGEQSGHRSRGGSFHSTYACGDGRLRRAAGLVGQRQYIRGMTQGTVGGLP